VNSALDEQMDVYRHRGVGNLFEGDRVGAGGEDAAVAEPARSFDRRTGAADLRQKAARVAEIAGPAGADEDDVAGADLRAAGALEVGGRNGVVLGERLAARDVEEDAAPEDRRDRVDGVALEPAGVRLGGGGLDAAEEPPPQEKWQSASMWVPTCVPSAIASAAELLPAGPT
jgi:hypothetical protein